VEEKVEMHAFLVPDTTTRIGGETDPWHEKLDIPACPSATALSTECRQMCEETVSESSMSI